MDRITWLKEMRRDCEEQYDREAPLYDEEGGVYSNIAHQQFIQEFLSLIPENRRILDAPCGTGRYLPFLLAKGHSIVGIDQSQGMLERAKTKFPTVQFEKIGLQEMAYQELFDGAICMNAMENIPPEDWSLVLSNFHQALTAHGYLYFTLKRLKWQMRTKSSKPSNGLDKPGSQLFMESGQTRCPIIIIQPVNRSESGLKRQDLKLSKKGMERFGITMS